MNSTHMRTPWHWEWGESGAPRVQNEESIIAIGATGSIGGGSYVDDLIVGNMRRICACVNACAGISTEALEIYGPHDVADIAENAANMAELVNAIEILLKEIAFFTSPSNEEMRVRQAIMKIKDQ